MPEETIRFVPMTEAQRDYLDSLPSNDTLYTIVANWDDATDIELDPPAGTCTRPPFGWYCTRSEGHDGPCPGRRIHA